MKPRSRPTLSRSAWALLALASLGLGLRLWRAWHADQYWDEGYLTEIAMDLGAGRRPHAGALWFNGLLPLTTSWLAPLSAAPFTWLKILPALMAVRVWAAVLGAVSVVGLGVAGKRLGSWPLGLAAAGLFALGPFSVALGGLGLYHHFATALAVWAWALAFGTPSHKESLLAHALAGLAAAACYWLWWVPLGLLLWRSPNAPSWPARLGLALAPLAVAVAMAFASGGEDALAMAAMLAAYSPGALSLRTLAASFVGYPVVWTGLAFLLFLGKGRRWAWVALLGLADAVRQRGDLSGSPYVLLPLLPFACLGLALWATWLGERSKWLAGLALALALVLCSYGSLEWIQRLSSPAPLGRNLTNFLRAQKAEQDTVIAAPTVNWQLRAVCKPVELAHAAAARGWSGGLVPGGLSARAFAFDPSLVKARFLVVSPLHFDTLFLDAHMLLEALAAEREGWPLVFENPGFRVYANPRYGVKRDPGVRILQDRYFYELAAVDAGQAGEAQWASFARSRVR